MTVWSSFLVSTIVIVQVLEIDGRLVNLAVIVAVCPTVAVDLAVTTPLLTVATLVLDEVQVISLFWFALLGTYETDNVFEPPGASSALESERIILVGSVGSAVPPL